MHTVIQIFEMDVTIILDLKHSVYKPNIGTKVQFKSWSWSWIVIDTKPYFVLILGDAIPLEASGWSTLETAVTPRSLLLGLRTALRRLKRFSGARVLRRLPRVRAATGRWDGLQVGLRRSAMSRVKVQFLKPFLSFKLSHTVKRSYFVNKTHI